MRRLLLPVATVLAVACGIAAAVALADVPTTGTNTACATATTPDHTVGVDGTDVHTIAGVSTTNCHVETYTIPTSTETVTQTVTNTTTTPPPPSGPLTSDPTAFPKIAEYVSFTTNAATMSKFALNVGDICQAGALDQSFATNPKQVNFTDLNNCANNTDFQNTYGRGYWAQTTPITGITYPHLPSTIRAANNSFCAGDWASTTTCTNPTSGSTCPDQSCQINFNHSGSATTTAEWAADLRSYYAYKGLGGDVANHPGIQGIFGDNWSYWSSNYSSIDSPQGFDDGLVRYGLEMQHNFPSYVIGGNGSAEECPSLNWRTYKGTIPNGPCSASDSTMFENETNSSTSPSGWDTDIPRFLAWTAAKSYDNHVHYGIVTIFGSPTALTPARERLGLAFATIGGQFAWLVYNQSAGWGTTAVPGGQNSIPEMGCNATYACQWLGQPTGDPVKTASGEWSRTFDHGTVYANTTGSNWSINGQTVPAHDALFVKT